MTSELATGRAALHAALKEAPLVRHDGSPLEQDRRHPLPQLGEYVMPCAWVGLASIVPTQTSDLELEVPLVLAFDGRETDQLGLIDENAALLWDAVHDVDTGAGPARPTAGTVQRLGPDGATTFGFVITVRLPLTTTTLCDPGHLAT